MSDGPYKSLPMRPKWKRFAECIYNEAFSPEEVRDALLAALAGDWHQEIPENLVNKIQSMLSDGQVDFFWNQNIQKLESLRVEAAEYPLLGVFLDYVIQAAAKGPSCANALLESTCQTLRDRAVRGARQVEEHYHKEPERNRVTDVRRRTEDAIKGLDIVMSARHLLGIEKNEYPRAPVKQTGLDEGVPL